MWLGIPSYRCLLVHRARGSGQQGAGIHKVGKVWMKRLLVIVKALSYLI